MFLVNKFSGTVFPPASDKAVLSKFWKSATANVILRGVKSLQSLVHFNCGDLILLDKFMSQCQGGGRTEKVPQGSPRLSYLEIQTLLGVRLGRLNSLKEVPKSF